MFTQTKLPWKMSDVYAYIMRDINEDLLLENLPLLEEKYKDESTSDRGKRFAQYRRDIEEYFNQFDAFIKSFNAMAHKAHKTLRNLIERYSDGNDDSNTDKLINSLQTL